MKIHQFHQFENLDAPDELLGLLGYDISYSSTNPEYKDFTGEIVGISKFDDDEPIGEDYYLISFKIDHLEQPFNLVVSMMHLKKLLNEGIVTYRANNVNQYTFNTVTLKIKELVETFVPKNIEKRQADFDRKQAEKPAKFQEYVKIFTTKLKSLQGLKVANPDEQHFVDMLQGLSVVLDPLKFPDKPYVIFLYHEDRFSENGLQNFYSFYYNWDDPEFYCLRRNPDQDPNFEPFRYSSSYMFQNYLEKMVNKYLDLECWVNVAGVAVR